VRLLGVWPETTVTGPRDARIAQVTGRQRGRIARRQLRAIGVASSAITWLTAHDRLFPLHRGVFAFGHRAPTELGDETAALLAAGDDAVLSRLSAAVLWGLLPPASGDGLIHITLPGRHGPTLPGVHIHRTRALTSADVRVRQGLPVVSPACALLDIAELVTARQFELACDQAMVDRIVTPGQIAELLARTSGRRAGVLLAAELARLSEGPTLTRSEAEELFLRLIRLAMLPVPRVNSRAHGYEIDFYWPQQRFAVEVDGYRFHSSRRAFEHDRRKDAALQAAGIIVLRVTWRQLQDEPFAIVARVAQCLARH
jgi:very-short-patch-repair endonuclease